MFELENYPLYDDDNVGELLASVDEFGGPGIYPRITEYGSDDAREIGIIPIEEADFPPEIPKSDWKDVIEFCHAKKIFPLYHQEATGLLKDWNQDGLGYCWAWSLTACVMGCRAVEGQPPVLLAPVSLGRSVNWRNEGNTLDRAIATAVKYGIAPQEYVGENKWNRNPSTYKPGWEQEALKYRPMEWFDINTYRSDPEKIIGQCLAVLSVGRPLYVAYNWWAHAVECVALEWNEKYPNNIVWLIQNSHADGVIKLTGQRGVPSEAYGIRATIIG